jgi:hypothetical protein
MKPVQSYQPCENCGKHLYSESPPPPRAYERGEIHLCGGSAILLPDEVVKARHVDGVTDGHAENLDGHYCDAACLAEHIRKILRKKQPKVSR